MSQTEGISHEEDKEIIPCFRIEESANYRAIVFLEISLLNYDYYLQTFDLMGNILSYQKISSMNSDGTKIMEKAARIDENLIIWTLSSEDDNDFDPSNSKFSAYRISEHGTIIPM